MSFIELAKKYSALSISNFEQESTNSILNENKDLLTAQKIRLMAESSVLEAEVEILKIELDEFILFYYENFISKILNNSSLDLQANIDQQNSHSNLLSIYDEDECEQIHFLSNRQKALDKNLKNAYRKLAKIFHPDTKNQVTNQHNLHKQNLQFSFNDLQELYENRNLEKMLEILENLKLTSFSSNNIVEQIEKIERELCHLKSNICYLKAVKEEILESPEYRLFNKYRMFEIRGLDFFLKHCKNLFTHKLS